MSNPARPDGGRAALAGFVTNRLGRNANRQAAPRPEPKATDASVQKFETLPGYRELRLQRSAADLIGLGNPFFRVHETRAGRHDAHRRQGLRQFLVLRLSRAQRTSRRQRGGAQGHRRVRHLGLREPDRRRRAPRPYPPRTGAGRPLRDRSLRRDGERPRHQRHHDRRLAGTRRRDLPRCAEP